MNLSANLLKTFCVWSCVMEMHKTRYQVIYISVCNTVVVKYTYCVCTAENICIDMIDWIFLTQQIMQKL